MSKKHHIYTFFRAGDVMVAGAKYNKQDVHGHCKFNPNDPEFNEEFGKKLAAARCDVKILHRKEVNSRKNAKKIANQIKELQGRLERERAFEAKAHQAYLDAVARAENIAHDAPSEVK